jgi:hypothetical protein
MRAHHPQSAKIMQHASGLGAPTPDQVRQRALELALIAGHDEITDADWRDAKRELHGGHGSPNADDETEMSSLVSERDMVVTDLGHHVENMGMEDTENVVEELIAEGMDEAVHEQMLAARQADDGGEDEEDATEDEPE